MPPSDDDRDGRNSLARGYILASRVTSIGMQMALPPAIGWWVDARFQTSPWWTILGALIGFVVSMLELVRFANDSNKTRE